MVNATLSKPRSAARSALAQLDDLDAAVREADQLPSALDDARRSAAGDLAVLRGRLQGLFALPEGERDDAEVARLSKAVADAEAASARPWADEKLGLEEVCRRAIQARDEWIADNFAALTHELDRLSTEIHAAEISAAESLIAAWTRREAIREQWERVVGPLQRPPGGLEARHQRLVDYPMPSASGPTYEARARIVGRVHEAVMLLKNTDLSGLVRPVPTELNSDVGGALPGGS